MKKSGKFTDSLLEWLKHLQRRYYSSDYHDQELVQHWMRRPSDARFEERVVPITVSGPLESILIFKPDEIGDAICSLPAIAELKRCFPQAKLSLICLRETLPIFARTGLFEQIVPVEVHIRWRRFRYLKLKAALERFTTAEFDLAIFLRTYPSMFADFLKIPSRCKVHARDPRLKSRSIYQPSVSLWGEKRVHQSLQLLELISAVTGLTYQHSDIRHPSFQWEEEDRLAMKEVFPNGAPPKYLVAHPFAKYETRRYPESYWLPLLEKLHAQFRVPVVLIGGLDDLDWRVPRWVVQSQGRLTIPQTAYLISRASGFIGNLSGPAHLAGALGVPTVTLMSGHSVPAEWAPVGKSLILRADVPCAPCHLWSCREYDLACLKSLTPDRVIPAVSKFFAATLSPNASQHRLTETATDEIGLRGL